MNISVKLIPKVARLNMTVILLILCVVLAVTAPNFFTWLNLLNILQQISTLGLVAFGMTIVIIAGEIDLSVASAVAFANCLVAVLFVKYGFTIPQAILVTLVAGFCIGILPGIMRSAFQVPTFITTLALLTGLRGAALKITEGFPVTGFPEWYSQIGSGYVLGVPVSVIILLIVFLLVHFLMSYTSFGRSIYAVGGNAEAARLCGIGVPMVKILVMAISGTLAALSGIVLSSRIMSGTPTVAQGWELEAITAVIIGGTSFMGGLGNIWGTLIGVLFIGVVINGMTLLGVKPYNQMVIKGLLILVAVFINATSNRQKERL